MKIKQKSQSGFGLVEALLLIIAIALVVFVGYYVWHTQKQTDKTLNQASATSQKTVPLAKQSATNSQLIADAIVNKCYASDPSINKTRLKNLLLKMFDGKNSTLQVEGNYATAGAGCDATGSISNPSPVGGGGFQTWLKKENGVWTVVLEGQEAPSCSQIDGQGWPSTIMQCFDETTQQLRAPK